MERMLCYRNTFVFKSHKAVAIICQPLSHFFGKEFMHCKSTLTKQIGQEKPPQHVQEIGYILIQVLGTPQGNY